MTHLDMEDQDLIVKALRKLGIDIRDINELHSRSFDIRTAAPVLIQLLDDVRSDHMRDAIIRAFARKEARGIAAKRFVEEFREACSGAIDDPSKRSLAWSIGNTLEQVADDSVAEELIDLVLNREFGTARQMVALAMGRLKDRRVPDILISLLEDEDIQGHVLKALGRLKSKKARTAIERHLTHKNRWVRNAARTALCRIDKDITESPSESDD